MDIILQINQAFKDVFEVAARHKEPTLSALNEVKETLQKLQAQPDFAEQLAILHALPSSAFVEYMQINHYSLTTHDNILHYAVAVVCRAPQADMFLLEFVLKVLGPHVLQFACKWDGCRPVLEYLPSSSLRCIPILDALLAAMVTHVTVPEQIRFSGHEYQPDPTAAILYDSDMGSEVGDYASDNEDEDLWRLHKHDDEFVDVENGTIGTPMIALFSDCHGSLEETQQVTLEALQVFLKYGLVPEEFEGDTRKSLLHIACQEPLASPAFVQLLLSTPWGRRAVHFRDLKGYTPLLRLLCELGTIPKDSAELLRRREVLRLLVQYGADPKAISFTSANGRYGGYGAVELACFGLKHAVRFVNEKDDAVVQRELDEFFADVVGVGADLNHANAHGHTALHMVVAHRHVMLMKTLLSLADMGLDFGVVSRSGLSVLSRAYLKTLKVRPNSIDSPDFQNVLKRALQVRDQHLVHIRECLMSGIPVVVLQDLVLAYVAST